MKRYVESPFGTVLVECDGRMVSGVSFVEKAEESADQSPALDAACREVSEFLAGERREFTVPIYMKGTDFELRVWAAICNIPYGETRTYAQIATAAKHPGAARAVGAVCAKNKVLLLVPCHRVIGSDGRITGYAAGADRKKKLLELEKK